MKKSLFLLTLLFSISVILPSCKVKMRPQDAERLKAEAEAGNLKSMETLMLFGDTLVSRKDHYRYLDILADNGNFRALSTKYTEEYINSGKLSEKQWQAMNMRWMEKGAKKGTPDCMYRLGVMYLEPAHLDSAKARQWLQQAADSLQAAARVDLRKMEGRQTVLDAPAFAFRQMWSYTARDKSFLNRFSNAVFHFMSECPRSCWKTLFGPKWWQSLLLAVFMFLVFALGVIYALTRSGTSVIPVAVSSLYGWLNGMTLFFFTKGKMAIPGILVSSDAIGQFTRQPATFGLSSDLCLWGSWICLIIIVLVYLGGLLERYRMGTLTVRTFLTYTLETLFSCVFFYCLAGAISATSRVIGFCVALLLIFCPFGGEMSEEKWQAYLAKLKAQAEENRRREAERERQREDRERWERIQESQRRNKWE